MRPAEVTFTRSRPGNSNDGAHVQQKNWVVVRAVVGYHRYDTTAELLLLNNIWLLQSQMTNYFLPQQKLLEKVRNGAKITKTYDGATVPHQRAVRHPAGSEHDKTIMADTFAGLNPAAPTRDPGPHRRPVDHDDEQERTRAEAGPSAHTATRIDR